MSEKQYVVYPTIWASGSPAGLDVLKEYDISFTVETALPNSRTVDKVLASIPSDVIVKISEKYDVLISGNSLAFDKMGGRFRQR